jgi:phosphoglycolate phosphatase/putative hydrolase of the HAD superfamily
MTSTCVSEVSPTQASDCFPAAGKPLNALIFDVDGTLYEQGRVRRAMLYRLLRAHITSPMRGVFTLQILRAYRNAQDTLRRTPQRSGDITIEQLLLASRVTGASRASVAACVARWMEQEPLPLLASSIRKEIVELLREAKRLGLRLAVCSDYPAERKLAAMGIAEFFDVVVSAQDPEVQRFKPDPAGLELTIRRLAVRKDEAVYIGDRADVDAVAASRAGIRHFILNGTQNLSELSRLLIRRS